MKFLVIFFLDIFDFFYRLSFVNFLKKNKIRKFDIILMLVLTTESQLNFLINILM